MKIIYKQPKNTYGPILDISNCYFKQLHYMADKPIVNTKVHHHTEYELHLIADGTQAYVLCGKNVSLTKNMFIIIPPYVKHRAITAPTDVQKFSITFQVNYVPDYSYFVGTLSETIIQNLGFIIDEAKRPSYYSNILLGNRVFETVLLLLRLGGYKEAPPVPNIEGFDERLILAKKYICDNITQDISAIDVANYCRLSTRHLTRLFVEFEEVPLSKYITQIKMQAVKEDLLSETISIKEISEKYSYNNEYYFNRAFKNHFGMSPGAYRQMHKKQGGD